MNEHVLINEKLDKPEDGQLIRFKFHRPVFGRQEFVGRYFAGLGVWSPSVVRGQAEARVGSYWTKGKKCMWSSVIEWWPASHDERERDV